MSSDPARSVNLGMRGSFMGENGKIPCLAVPVVDAPPFHGVIQRFFTWVAHNLDAKGENTRCSSPTTPWVSA